MIQIFILFIIPYKIKFCQYQKVHKYELQRGIEMDNWDYRNKEELLQQMRRQAEIKPEQTESEPSVSSGKGTFKIRLALAGVLLLTIILLDQKGKCFAGISMNQVLQYVTAVDYGTYLETWVETAVNGSQAL